MLKQAGASVISLPSNEIYAAMQTGAMDAAMTSSTSFISFKLEEIAKHLTTGRQKTYWFMLEPLMISKTVFAALPKAQQDVVMAVGAELEAFGRDAARADDKNAADIYAKAGAKLYDIDEPTLKKWQAIAVDTAWKDFGEKSESCAGAAQGRRRSCCECRTRGAGAKSEHRPRHAGMAAATGGAPFCASTRRWSCSACWRCLRPPLVLTYSVVSRYVTKASTDWQDEAAVFLPRRRHLHVRRVSCNRFAGHVGIEAIAGLSAALGRPVAPVAGRHDVRAVSARSLRGKSWTLFHEAWGRQADHLVVVGAAAVDPLCADGRGA